VWGALRAASLGETPAVVRHIEALGYGSLWTGETIGGKEAFAHTAVVLCATSTMTVGTGIANIWARHPATMEGGAATLAAGWPGRFVLGVGVSHAPIVARSGQEYLKPYDRMVAYLDAMDSAGGAPAGPTRCARVLAALGPRMLELARDRSDGAHPYFVPPSHAPLARGVLGPDRLLVPEQAVVVATDPVEARRVARGHMATYLTLPNYVSNLRRLGYGDDDLAGGGSDRLVDAIVAWGDEQAIADRVEELLAAGADHVLVQPLAADVGGVVAQLERLAPVLTARRPE
jgi:probable F420-dependent oxidoreductase